VNKTANPGHGAAACEYRLLQDVLAADDPHRVVVDLDAVDEGAEMGLAETAPPRSSASRA
jgi:hypothetical protein